MNSYFSKCVWVGALAIRAVVLLTCAQYSILVSGWSVDVQHIHTNRSWIRRLSGGHYFYKDDDDAVRVEAVAALAVG